MRRSVFSLSLLATLGLAWANPCSVEGTALRASVSFDGSVVDVSIQGHEVEFVRSIEEGKTYARTGTDGLACRVPDPSTCSAEVVKGFGPFPAKLTILVRGGNASCSFVCHQNHGLTVDGRPFEGYVCHGS